jgi:hypothetical protein
MHTVKTGLVCRCTRRPTHIYDDHSEIFSEEGAMFQDTVAGNDIEHLLTHLGMILGNSHGGPPRRYRACTCLVADSIADRPPALHRPSHKPIPVAVVAT